MKHWPYRYIIYIILQIFEPFIVFTVTLTGVVWLARSLQYVDLIVNKGLSITSFIWFVALIAPKILCLILPLITYLAIIFAYYKLWTDSEIMVIRSSGVSKIGVALPAILFGTIIAIIVLIIETNIAPSNYTKFKDLQIQMRNNFVASVLQEGAFHSPIPGITVYISGRSKDGQINNILIHDQRNNEEESTIIAKRGLIEITDEGPKFAVFEGSRQMFSNRTKKLSILHFDRYTFSLENTSTLNEPRHRQLEERRFSELFNPEEKLAAKEKNRYKAEAHRRIISPLIILLMTLISTGSLLIGSFEQKKPVKKVIYGSILAFLLQASYLSSASILSSYPFLALAPYLIFIILVIIWYLMLNYENNRTFYFKKQ